MAPFLETGHANAIEEAKRLWRRKYKAEWRRAKRKQAKEITTSWEKEEYRTLRDEAKRHRQSVTGFIKQSAQAYMDKRYIVPDEEQVTKIMQLLALTYNSILELTDNSTIPADAGRKVLFDLYQLEKDIRVTLYSPKTIEQVLKDEVARESIMRQRLIKFLETL